MGTATFDQTETQATTAEQTAPGEVRAGRANDALLIATRYFGTARDAPHSKLLLWTPAGPKRVYEDDHIIWSIENHGDHLLAAVSAQGMEWHIRDLQTDKSFADQGLLPIASSKDALYGVHEKARNARRDRPRAVIYKINHRAMEEVGCKESRIPAMAYGPRGLVLSELPHPAGDSDVRIATADGSETYYREQPDESLPLHGAPLAMCHAGEQLFFVRTQRKYRSAPHVESAYVRAIENAAGQHVKRLTYYAGNIIAATDREVYAMPGLEQLLLPKHRLWHADEQIVGLAVVSTTQVGSLAGKIDDEIRRNRALTDAERLW